MTSNDLPVAKEQRLSLPLAEYSPITAFTRWAFWVVKRFSVMYWLGRWCTILKPRSELTTQEIMSVEFARRRGNAIEAYILCWLIVEGILVTRAIIGFWPKFEFIAGVVITCRIVEVMQVTVNMTLFDALSGRSDNIVASHARMIVLSAINFIELCLCFGIIYADHFNLLRGAGRPIVGFYLSIITQLTIGYGDVYPVGWLRVIAAIQGIAGLTFVVLIFGRFMASLPQIHELFEEKKSKSDTSSKG
ncbi:MAG TPA: potassium channel family protein [Tepidisphaeraceae bacterium]|nr:potassium channel family protein [Tepidisphaeraceae bacterium]